MSGDVWLSFVGTKAAIGVTPGPAVMLVLAQGLMPGGRSLWAATGILAVNGLFFVLAALGLGALIATSSEVFVAIKWISCAYLVFAGLRVLMGRSMVFTPGTAAMRSGGQTAWTGALLQLANPNALFFFGAMLPQFVDPRDHLLPQIVTLGATGLTLDFLILMSYGAFAARLGTLVSSPRFGRITSMTAGTLLVAAGVFAATMR